MSGGDSKVMFKAIQENDLELVRFYLHSGIDPNYQHPEYWALAESIRYNNIEISELLLENGADPLIKEMESAKTPIEIAQKVKNKPALGLLAKYS